MEVITFTALTLSTHIIEAHAGVGAIGGGGIVQRAWNPTGLCGTLLAC